MKRILVDIDGVQRAVWAEKIKGVLWLHYQGRTFALADEESRSSRGARGSSSKSRGEIHAPMPGKVTKVLVQSGTSVSVGAALVVMEAMKMEYTLSADGNGKVNEVKCRPGDQVTLGQLLVRLNLAEAKP